MAEVPKKIGRYTVGRLLGAGAMGNVYLALDPELDRSVAIKTVRYQSLPSDSLATFLERFKNEARAAARVHQPNIVQVYDVGEDAAVGPYLVFEYVPGSTLKQMLRARGALSPHAVVLLAEEMADALAAAHHQGIIHRDIKPDNLLITESGHAKLADFGVARLPNADLTREGQFLGTPCYAAPETLKEGRYGPETDLFSMAAVLYEAITGTRAFPGDDAVAVAHKVIHDTPERPSAVGRSVPRELDPVFDRALKKSARERYATPFELARAVRAAYEDARLIETTGVISLPPREPNRTAEDADDDAGAFSLATVSVLVGILAIGIALVIAFNRDREADAVLDASISLPAPIREAPPRPRRAQGRARPAVDASESGAASPEPPAAPEASDAPAPSPELEGAAAPGTDPPPP